ncbi:MAG: (Fe-S)-binding protein [Candidatus Altiarchaeota archaeon]
MVDKKLILSIYELLPLTDCGQCSLKTCREFAEKVALGEKNAYDCIPIAEENAEKIILIMDDYFR